MGNGEITTREFYDAQMAALSRIDEVEQRILDRIDKRMDDLKSHHDDDITRVEGRLNRWSSVNSIGAAIAIAFDFIFWR